MKIMFAGLSISCFFLALGSIVGNDDSINWPWLCVAGAVFGTVSKGANE